jgi:hypothetical protein
LPKLPSNGTTQIGPESYFRHTNTRTVPEDASRYQGSVGSGSKPSVGLRAKRALCFERPDTCYGCILNPTTSPGRFKRAHQRASKRGLHLSRLHWARNRVRVPPTQRLRWIFYAASSAYGSLGTESVQLRMGGDGLMLVRAVQVAKEKR